jgi:cytoskeletal protein RodZ
MLQFLNKKLKARGQSTMEYAVLTVVIIGALLTIQNYVKRGVQGRLKSAADDIGDQYSDGNQNEVRTTIKNSTTEETFNAGVTTSNLLTPEITNQQTISTVVNSQHENWGGTGS